MRFNYYKTKDSSVTSFMKKSLWSFANEQASLRKKILEKYKAYGFLQEEGNIFGFLFEKEPDLTKYPFLSFYKHIKEKDSFYFGYTLNNSPKANKLKNSLKKCCKPLWGELACQVFFLWSEEPDFRLNIQCVLYEDNIFFKIPDYPLIIGKNSHEQFVEEITKEEFEKEFKKGEYTYMKKEVELSVSD